MKYMQKFTSTEFLAVLMCVFCYFSCFSNNGIYLNSVFHILLIHSKCSGAVSCRLGLSVTLLEGNNRYKLRFG